MPAKIEVSKVPAVKGCLRVGNGTKYERFCIGTDGQVLTANSTKPEGVEWKTPAAGGGGGIELSEVEVDLGSPKRSGKFNITGTGFTASRPVIVQQAYKVYTGKGLLDDEAEMDTVLVKAIVSSVTNIKCIWDSRTLVRGNFKFNYAIV